MPMLLFVKLGAYTGQTDKRTGKTCTVVYYNKRHIVARLTLIHFL